MELIKKKKRQESKSNPCTFPVSGEMKREIDKIKLAGEIDVNEMFRQLAEKIIEQSKRTA